MENIIGLIVSQYRLILCPYTLDTMNSNIIIYNSIGLQKMFYLEIDMIMQSNVVLRSYAAFSC